jgi:hypothetical protein
MKFNTNISFFKKLQLGHMFIFIILLRTATHTRLRIALEAPKLKVVTLEARKLKVVTLEVVLILKEQVQLVLMRVRDNVPRLSIYTARTLLGKFKVGKSAPPSKLGKVRTVIVTVTSVTFKEKSTPPPSWEKSAPPPSWEKSAPPPSWEKFAPPPSWKKFAPSLLLSHP